MAASRAAERRGATPGAPDDLDKWDRNQSRSTWRCYVRARGCVSSRSAAATTPETAVRAATTQIAAGIPAAYHELDSPHGHDAFLIENDRLGAVIRPFLARLEADHD